MHPAIVFHWPILPVDPTIDPHCHRSPVGYDGGMKAQFRTASLLLTTAFMAVWVGGALASHRLSQVWGFFSGGG